MQLIPEAQYILENIKNNTLVLNDVIDSVYNDNRLKPYLKLFKKSIISRLL